MKASIYIPFNGSIVLIELEENAAPFVQERAPGETVVLDLHVHEFADAIRRVMNPTEPQATRDKSEEEKADTHIEADHIHSDVVGGIDHDAMRQHAIRARIIPPNQQEKVILTAANLPPLKFDTASPTDLKHIAMYTPDKWAEIPASEIAELFKAIMWAARDFLPEDQVWAVHRCVLGALANTLTNQQLALAAELSIPNWTQHSTNQRRDRWLSNERLLQARLANSGGQQPGRTLDQK